MREQIQFQGVQVAAHDLVRKSAPTSWPDIYTTDVRGVLLRWQYANKNGPCPKHAADRLVIPFAHAGLPKGTEVALATPVRR